MNSNQSNTNPTALYSRIDFTFEEKKKTNNPMNQTLKLILAIMVIATSGCSPSEDADHTNGATTPWIGNLTIKNHEYQVVTIKHDEMGFPYRSPVVIFNKNETASWKAELIKNVKLGKIDFGSSKPNMTGSLIVYVEGNKPTMSILATNPDETKIEELGGLEEYLAFLISQN